MDIQAFITSSTNPEKVSLFIKSLATFLVLFGFDSAVVNEGGGQLTNFLVGVGMVVSAVTSLYGLTRKAYMGRWHA